VLHFPAVFLIQIYCIYRKQRHCFLITLRIKASLVFVVISFPPPPSPIGRHVRPLVVEDKTNTMHSTAGRILLQQTADQLKDVLAGMVQEYQQYKGRKDADTSTVKKMEHRIKVIDTFLNQAAECFLMVDEEANQNYLEGFRAGQGITRTKQFHLDKLPPYLIEYLANFS